MNNHTHQLIYIGELAGEYGGTYSLRWCVECGTLVGFLKSGTGEVVPEFAKKIFDHTKAKYAMVHRPLVSSVKRSGSNVLGRTLNELMARGPKARKLPGE